MLPLYLSDARKYFCAITTIWIQLVPLSLLLPYLLECALLSTTAPEFIFPNLSLIVTQITAPHSPEFPPSAKVFFPSFAHHNSSRPLYPIRSLNYHPLSRDRKGCSPLPPPFSSQLSLFCHFDGSTHPQLAPPACGWLDNTDLYTARGFMDPLISRLFKVHLASYHMKTALWVILHLTAADGIVQVNGTQCSIFGS